ncbi:hypothetical protein GF336_05200 [Candidatus Woesearchaeota archaeon]|nr:hypothetical protein [Candidatus Woesearchaeota archaeon]
MTSRIEGSLNVEQYKELFNSIKIKKKYFDKLVFLSKSLEKSFYEDRDQKGFTLTYEKEDENRDFENILKEFLSDEKKKEILEIKFQGEIPEHSGIFKNDLIILNNDIKASFKLAVYLYKNKLVSKERYIKDILKNIADFAVALDLPYYFRRYFSKEYPNFDALLDSITDQRDNKDLYFNPKENYLRVILIFKILSEIMDSPLKGKSLEEYRKAIIKECEVLEK